MAILASTIANVNRGKGRRASPADFLPRWAADKPAGKAKSGAVAADVAAVMASFGAR